MAPKSKVTVAVRIKPENRPVRRCITTNEQPDQIEVGKKLFQYDHVYGEGCSQAEVYETSVRKLVVGCFKGYNATVLAYGQTGSGKTHSVVGLPQDSDDEGIIPRALRQVFGTLENARYDDNINIVSVHVSFLEIYNEECKDLLHTDIPTRDIMIREDKDGRIFFTGAREEIVSTFEEALKFLELGNLQRTTAGTFMNATSSRSHAIFSVSLELFEYHSKHAVAEADLNHEDEEGIQEGQGAFIQSKLHLVDLAGSERAKKTGAEGLRLKESVGINQGLLALGKVIRALTTAAQTVQGPSKQFVPYRESKLTRFLQDSLGGNSCTVMLACVSAADSNAHETLSTLQYASRARAVQNRVKANRKSTPLAVLSEEGGVLDSQHGHADGGMESALVSALRLQLAQMGEEMLQIKQDKQKLGQLAWGGPPSPRKQQQQSKILDGGEDSSLLRASINSLYDSISSGRHQVVGKGNALKKPAGTSWTGGSQMGGESVVEEKNQQKDVNVRSNPSLVFHLKSSLLPQLEEIQLDLEASLVELGPEITSNRQYLEGLFWRLICTASAGSESLSEIVKNIHNLGDSHTPSIEVDSPHRSPPRRSFGSEKLFINKANKLNISQSVIRTSFPYSLQEVEHSDSISQLKEELQTCYEDLHKDEEIFQEKMRELKKCRKVIKHLEAEKKLLYEENQTQYQKLQKALYDGRTDMFLKPKAESKDDFLPSTPMKSISADAEAKPANFSSPFNRGAKDLDISEEEVTELERQMSEVVLGAEPDISALVEDLESIQQERDKLQGENKAIEQRLGAMAEESERQQSSFLEHQHSLARRLQELEIGIKLKQECISNLVRQEHEAADTARQNFEEAQRLKQEASALHKELEKLKNISVKDRREADGERSKRRLLEQKQEKIELELKDLQKAAQKAEKKRRNDKEQENKRKEDAHRAEQHHSELLNLREEYTKLTSQLTSNENKHRKDLDHLTGQVRQQRKISDESKQHIAALEAKNAELTARLERSGRQLKERNASSYGPGSANKISRNSTPKKMFSREQEGGIAFGRGSAGPSNRQNSGTSPVQGGGSVYSVASTHSASTIGKFRQPLVFSPNSQISGVSRLSPDWLIRRVEEMAQARSARQEVKKLEAQCKDLEKERAQMQIDCKHARKAQSERDFGTAPYLKQLAEIDSKLERAKKIANRAVHGSKKAKEANKTVRTLEQRRQDASNRMARFSHKQLHQGDSESQAVHDLTEDLETLEAELDLNKVRLEEERRKLVRGGDSDSAEENSGDISANTAEATILAREIENRAVGELAAHHVDAMVTVAQALVDAKHRRSSDAAEILELQCRLDEKESEYDELADAMHRSRAEMLKKLEIQRRESEDKVAFLLQQLRAVEARNLETSSILRSRDVSVMPNQNGNTGGGIMQRSLDSLDFAPGDEGDGDINMCDLELDEGA